MVSTTKASDLDVGEGAGVVPVKDGTRELTKFEQHLLDARKNNSGILRTDNSKSSLPTQCSSLSSLRSYTSASRKVKKPSSYGVNQKSEINKIEPGAPKIVPDIKPKTELPNLDGSDLAIVSSVPSLEKMPKLTYSQPKPSVPDTSSTLIETSANASGPPLPTNNSTQSIFKQRSLADDARQADIKQMMIAPMVHGLNRPGTAGAAKPKAGRLKFPNAPPPPTVIMNQAAAAASAAAVESMVGPPPPLPPSRGGRTTPSTVKPSREDVKSSILRAQPQQQYVVDSINGNANNSSRPPSSVSNVSISEKDNAGVSTSGAEMTAFQNQTGQRANRTQEEIFQAARKTTQNRTDEVMQQTRERAREFAIENAAVSTRSADIAAQNAINLYNTTVAALLQKVYQKGKFAVLQYFTALDSQGTGMLSKDEFLKALSLFNFSESVTNDVVTMLVSEITKDSDSDDKVNYQEFCEALRAGNIRYRKDVMMPSSLQGSRRRQGPNPEQPFGDAKNTMPFGLMRDADKNVKIFDRSMDKLFEDLRQTFLSHDTQQKGYVNYSQFKAALEDMNETQGLNLSEEEIVNIFNEADSDNNGSVEYSKLLHPDGQGKRFMPEFVKPKSLRRSQSGHPWMWFNEIS